jgi:hypothetical protein
MPGAKATLAKLTPIVYAELQRLVRRYLRRGHSLQATALVNEAYIWSTPPGGAGAAP